MWFSRRKKALLATLAWSAVGLLVSVDAGAVAFHADRPGPAPAAHVAAPPTAGSFASAARAAALVELANPVVSEAVATSIAPAPSPPPAPPAPATPLTTAAPIAPRPATPPAPTAAPPASSLAANWPAGAEAWIAIPSLNLSLPIFMGGQSVIDRGVATHYLAAGWRAPVAPGAAGTYWLAAHHVTHGAPFLNVPNIKVGAEIDITDRSQTTYRYRVTGMETVGTSATDATVYGTDPAAAKILLQTCLGSAYRLLVHGILIGPAG